MATLVDEVARSERLDDAARERLSAELRRADPAAHSSLLHCFRAGLACRSEAESQDKSSPRGTREVSKVVAAEGSPSSRRTSQETPAKQRETKEPAKQERQTGDADKPPCPPLPSSAQQSSGDSPKLCSPADGWKRNLAAAIASLESDLHQSAQSEADSDRQTRLRLLYLAAGRREDALRPMASSGPIVQDFWRREMGALSLWMDAEGNSDLGRRAGAAREELVGAAAALGAMAPLSIRSMAFIHEVQSYGVIKSFAKCEFQPQQEVLLYAEVENFTSQESGKGYLTALRGSYQIFDGRGQQVDAHELGTTEDLCHNQRRDFFLGYRVRLPKRLSAGKHTLQLTVQDLTSRKSAQSVLEFSVKE